MITTFSRAARLRSTVTRVFCHSLSLQCKARDPATAAIWETSGRCVELSGRQTLNPIGLATPGCAQGALTSFLQQGRRVRQSLATLDSLSAPFFRALEGALAARRTPHSILVSIAFG